LAAIASAAVLIGLGYTNELRRRTVVLLAGWFVGAAYCQFFGGSPLVAATGLALQTLLAIGLIVRSRMT
jgi:hypothetical protein